MSGIESVESAGVVSPFAQTDSETPSTPQSLVADDQPLELNSENVDKMLDEVHPYLISDGGKNECLLLSSVTFEVRWLNG